MTGPRAAAPLAQTDPAISSPRSRASHLGLAAAIVAAFLTSQAAECFSATRRPALRRRMRRSAARSAQVAALIDSGMIERIERAYREMLEPPSDEPNATRPGATSIDPIIRAILGDKAVQRALGPIAPAKDSQARSWVEFERDKVTHKATVRLTSRAAKESLGDAMAAARAALTALGFRVVFAEIFRTPKMQANTGILRVAHAKPVALAR